MVWYMAWYTLIWCECECVWVSGGADVYHFVLTVERPRPHRPAFSRLLCAVGA